MMKLFTKRNKACPAKPWRSGGYSLIEVLFYISILGVLSLVVIDSLIVMTKAFRETTINRDILQAGNIMERITRDIRNSQSILSMNQDGTNLRLNTLSVSQVYQPVDFKLVNRDIQLYENDVFIGNLNSPDISIVALIFDPTLATQAGNVKISMTVQSNHYGSTRTETFYDTVVLRGAY